jgi:hypothetical protein
MKCLYTCTQVAQQTVTTLMQIKCKEIEDTNNIKFSTKGSLNQGLSTQSQLSGKRKSSTPLQNMELGI